MSLYECVCVHTKGTRQGTSYLTIKMHSYAHAHVYVCLRIRHLPGAWPDYFTERPSSIVMRPADALSAAADDS